MLVAERFEGNKIHLIDTETSQIFEFNKDKIPFIRLSECGISYELVVEAIKNII